MIFLLITYHYQWSFIFLLQLASVVKLMNVWFIFCYITFSYIWHPAFSTRLLHYVNKKELVMESKNEAELTEPRSVFPIWYHMGYPLGFSLRIPFLYPLWFPLKTPLILLKNLVYPFWLPKIRMIIKLHMIKFII